MNKVLIIIQREFLTRVKKRSFLVMTLLGPLLIALMYGGIIWIALSEEESHQHVAIVDYSEYYLGERVEILNSQKKLSFDLLGHDINKAKNGLFEQHYTSILVIPRDPVNNPNAFKLLFKDRPGITAVRTMERHLSHIIEGLKMEAENINKDTFESIRTDVRILQTKIKESGESEEVGNEPYIVGMVFSILIYFFIFLYGSQVLRGVIEEKTNRIVEIIVSSVKPFQLMLGKIIGIALVGLTQFAIWVILSGTIISMIGTILVSSSLDTQAIGEAMSAAQPGMPANGENPQLDKVLSMIQNINFPLMLGAFLFYFLGGYLLYSSLFAAIGAMVDSEVDSQQFMLPVTIPLIFSIAIAQFVVKNPGGIWGQVFSIFPLTSPIVMMVRIPFGVQIWELAVSMLVLILSFIGTTWMAGRIYKTGILLYGKKTTYKDLWLWLRKS